MVKPELINFIKSSRARGVSNADIKKILIQKGWDAKDVNFALNARVEVGGKVLDYVKTYSAKGYSRQDITSALLKSGVARGEIDKAFASVGPVSSGSSIKSTSEPFYKKTGFLIGIGLLALLIIFGTLGVVLYGMFAGEEPATSGCMSDRDCGSGYECVAGVCIVSSDECDSDSDCSSGYECSGGDCVYVGSSSECVVDSDCGTGEVCQTGDCIVDPDECGSDSDCDSGEECVDGDCVEEDGVSPSYNINCTGACSGSCPGSCSGTETLSGVTYYSNIEVLDVTLGSISNLDDVEFDIKWNNSGDAKFGDDWHINCSLYNDDGLIATDKKKVSDYFEAGEDYSTSCELGLSSYVSTMSLLDDVELIVTMDMYNNITESNESDNNFTYSATWNRSNFEAGYLPPIDCNYVMVAGMNVTVDGYEVVINEVYYDVNISVDNVSANLSVGFAVVNGLDVEVVSYNSPVDYVNITFGGRGSCPVAGVECTVNSDCTFAYEGCQLGQCVWVGVNAAIPQCSNGVDDDFDGACDYAGCDIDGDGVNEPSDPGCAGVNDDDERSDCYDFWDNDGDGFCDAGGCVINGVTLPADPGCFGPADEDEYNECYGHGSCAGNANGEVCSNVDYTCVQCMSSDYCAVEFPSTPICSGSVCVGCVNDQQCADQNINYPVCNTVIKTCVECNADVDCADGYDCDVVQHVCEATECNDNIDNDGDGSIDYDGYWALPEDEDCVSINDVSEGCADSDDCSPGYYCSYNACEATQCYDLIDNDPWDDDGIDYSGVVVVEGNTFRADEWKSLVLVFAEDAIDTSDWKKYCNVPTQLNIYLESHCTAEEICENYVSITGNITGYGVECTYYSADPDCESIDDNSEGMVYIPGQAQNNLAWTLAPEQESSFFMKLWNAIWFSEPVDLWNFWE